MIENDTIAETNENIIVDVATYNRFETLADVDDNIEKQAQHHPEPKFERESSDQKATSDTTSSVTSSSSSSSERTSSSRSTQERIQCNQCLRKCVDKRHMEHHIFLWHTDSKTQILMPRKKHATSDS